MNRFIFLTLVFSLTAARAEEALVILRDECLRCHNQDKRKGGLLIETREQLMEGGDSGPAIVPGQSAKSFLIETLHADAETHMPPKSQLSEAQVAALKKWVDAGAPWNADLIKAPRTAAEPGTLSELPENYQPITAMKASPDGNRLAVGRGDRILIYDFSGETAQLTNTLEGQRDTIQSLAWSPDGKALASGGYRRIFVWDADVWERVAILEDTLKGRVTAVAFSQDGKRLLAGDSLPTSISRLHVFDTGNWKLAQTVEAHSDSIFAIEVRPDGKQIATASADKLVKLWAAGTLKPEGTLEAHTGYVLALAYSPQSDRIASAGDDETVRVWSLDTGKQISSFGDRKPTGPITSLFWTLDPAKKDAAPPKKDEPASPPDWIVAVSEDGTPRAYTDIVIHEGAQTSAGAKMRAWSPGDSALTAVSFLAGKQWVVAGGETGKPQAWDTTGKLVELAAQP